MAASETDLKLQNTYTLVEKLSAVGWGIFFIWAGAAFLTGASWGVGLLGVGVIILGGESARRCFSLAVNLFWLIMGGVFVVWSICELFKTKFSDALLPILRIVIGVAILVAALRPRGYTLKTPLTGYAGSWI